MAFRFAPDRPAADEVLRMARAQTDAALAGLADPDGRRVAATIFDVRKRCKKARAVLRLVREPMGEKRYRQANVAYRDAGRALAGYRDAGAAALAFEWLLAADDRTAAELDVAAVRVGLAARRAAAVPQGEAVGPALAEARWLLEQASRRLDRMALDDDGWDLLGDGVAAVYARGAVATRRAVRKSTPARFHELRKQVKYTRYHLRMLRRTSPMMVLPLLEGFELVGDHLGQARDLLLLAEAVDASADGVGGDDQAARLMALADQRRTELEAVGLGVARRLYAEEPDAFAARLGRYWELRTSSGPEPTTAMGPVGASPAMATTMAIPGGDAPAAAVESESVSGSVPAAVRALAAESGPGAGSEPVSGPDRAPASEPDSEPAADSALEGMTVAALRALARDREIAGRSHMNRSELMAALRASS
ncbi:MAG: CHAD domain-containing protein [Actinomycetota bacterium]